MATVVHSLPKSQWPPYGVPNDLYWDTTGQQAYLADSDGNYFRISGTLLTGNITAEAGPQGPAGPQGVAIVQQGPSADLPTLAVGQQYFATDTNILYVGTPDGNSPTTALPLFGLEADIPQDLPIGILYYATDTNTLFVSTGPGNTLVVPVMRSGPAASIPRLPTGIFYLATDTNALYVGTPTDNLFVGPGGASTSFAQLTGQASLAQLPSPLDAGTF